MESKNKWREVYNRIILNKYVIIKIFFFIIMLLAFKYFILNNIQKVNIFIDKVMENSELAVLMAALIGSISGGVINYIVNTRAIIKQNHIKSAIINKNVCYGPLLNELKNFRQEIKKKELLFIDKNIKETGVSSVNYKVWNRIKNDNRYYQLPKFYIKKNKKLDSEIENYENSIKKILKISNDTLCDICKDLGCYKKGEKYEITFGNYLGLLIEKPEQIIDILLKDNQCNSPNIPLEKQDLVSNKFYEIIKEKKVIEEHKNLKTNLINQLEDLINMTELIITRISKKYESKNIF